MTWELFVSLAVHRDYEKQMAFPRSTLFFLLALVSCMNIAPGLKTEIILNRLSVLLINPAALAPTKTIFSVSFIFFLDDLFLLFILFFLEQFFLTSVMVEIP